MRRFAMGLAAGILAFGLLTACAPTEVDDSQRPATSFSPETTPPFVYDRTPDPNLPSMEMMFIFRVSSDGAGMERVQFDEEEMNEQVLLDKLIEFGVLDEGTEILSFEIEGEAPAGPGSAGEAAGGGSAGGELIGTLDLSAVPAQPDEDAETMMLNAIGNTFIENYELNKLKLLVNGVNYSGSHVTLGDDDYLEYDPDYVNTVDETDAGEDAGFVVLEEEDETAEETSAQ